jgi:hypothetical protein
MKFRKRILRVGMGGLLHVTQQMYLPAAALAPVTGLEFRELNITGDEYVVIQNAATVPIELNQFWLGYIGNDVATAVPSQQLPDVVLEPGETLMLSNGAAETCGAVAIDDLGPSLANSAGTLALWSFDTADGAANFGFVSSVSWGKAVAGINDLHIADEANVEKYNNVDARPSWLRTDEGWQIGDKQGCEFTPVISATTTEPTQSVNWQVSDDTPPFTVLSAVVLSSGGATAAKIPAGDIGLKAVILSEIFPNPASPQTDADDEFVELYNPNTKAFDLSGFKIQFGSTTSSTIHNYTIPDGTMLPAKSFKAFTSATSSLALNNTAGQVWFVDPLDHTVTTTGLYNGVKEGQSYINTNGKWHWTGKPTPGSANLLQSVITSVTGHKTATINGRSVSAINSSSGVAGTATDGSFEEAAQVVPIHPGTLAAVIGLALLYLAYEYRRDLQNRLHQFREHRKARA